MKSKQILFLFCLSASVLGGCNGQNQQCNAHFDLDLDGICDNCHKPIICENHIDLNGDGYCDNCFKPITPTPCTNHIDLNNDNKCDNCGETIDPMRIVLTRIKCSGTLTKKHYAYTDDWDFSGITCFGVYSNGSERMLNSSEFTVSGSPAKPSQYISALSVDVVAKENTRCQAAMSVTDITVDVAPWNFNSEVSNYYQDANLTLSSSSLMSELQRHSFAKHTTFVKYGDIKNYKTKTSSRESCDLVPNESKNELFFTGLKANYNAGNREHIWASANSRYLWEGSDLKDNNYVGGGSDLYHVRPTTEEINSAHGNGLYVDFDDFSYRNITLLGDGGPYKVKFYGLDSSRRFCDYLEVDDHMKGDLARILAYVYMHYGNNGGVPSGKSSMTGNLSLSDVLGYSSSKCIDKLIEWNELDPVSEVEKYRNHTVQLIQGNRNPFVDHPELIRKAFK